MSLRVKVERVLFITFVIIPGAAPLERAGADGEMARCLAALYAHCMAGQS